MKRLALNLLRMPVPGLALGLALSWPGDPLLADGVVIDKIYHPYVQPLEQEFEWRASMQDRQPGVADHLRVHHLGYARSLGDRWFGEVYLIGQGSDDAGLDVEAYELEARRQLTEQGEYWADWGLMFEIEKAAGHDAWEFSTGLLAEKEWGRWSGTANFRLRQEWGSDISDELETRIGLQARYRHSPSFEPAFEFYGGEHTYGIGPVALGAVKLSSGQQLGWEVGAIFGLDHSSPDLTLRFLLEFEF